MRNGRTYCSYGYFQMVIKMTIYDKGFFGMTGLQYYGAEKTFDYCMRVILNYALLSSYK
jgi:hypothetical protein